MGVIGGGGGPGGDWGGWGELEVYCVGEDGVGELSCFSPTWKLSELLIFGSGVARLQGVGWDGGWSVWRFDNESVRAVFY